MSCVQEVGHSVDSHDARGNIPNTRSYAAGDHPVAAGPSDLNFEYRMDHGKRGKFIIINNKNFQQQTGMSSRSGTDVDAANLHRLFKELRFEVSLLQDRTAEQMMKAMIDAGNDNHADSDCFGVAVLSHGEEGMLFGTDTQISIESLIAPIKNCQSLAGKPKLFFFQACRGQGLDEGMKMTADADSDDEFARRQIRIPLEADFLYAYSTTPGYFSWRNSTKGSWFVQALYKVLSDKELRSKIDLGRLLTRVSYIVAYDYESNASSAYMNQKKQVPSIVSMLTKEVYFRE